MSHVHLKYLFHFFFLNCFCLFEMQRDRALPFLINPLEVCSGQEWVRPKPGAKSSVHICHVKGRDSTAWAITAASLVWNSGKLESEAYLGLQAGDSERGYSILSSGQTPTLSPPFQYFLLDIPSCSRIALCFPCCNSGVSHFFISSLIGGLYRETNVWTLDVLVAPRASQP